MKTKPITPLIVAFILLWTGCMKEVDHPLTSQSNFPDEVQATGSVVLPSGSAVSVTSLKITAGVISQTTPQPNGSMVIGLRKDATQLVSAATSDGSPILLSIIARGQEGSSVQLNAQTTAEAMIFLNPAVVIADPALADLVLGIIRSLPETRALTSIIGSAIASDAKALVTDNSAISNAILAASTRFVGIVDSLGSQAGTGVPGVHTYRELKHYSSIDIRSVAAKSLKVASLIISPAVAQSGVSVNATLMSGNSYKVRVGNERKRFVKAFLDDAVSGSELGSALLFSRKSLYSLSPLSPSYADISPLLDISAHPRTILRAYAPGAQDFSALKAAPMWGARIAEPLVCTAIMDFFVPIFQVVMGMSHLSSDQLGSTWLDFVATLLYDPAFVAQITADLSAEDYAGAVFHTVMRAGKVMIENPQIPLNILKAAGLSWLQSILTAALVPLKLIFALGPAFDAICALGDFIRSSCLVTFTLTSSETNSAPNPPMLPSPSDLSSNQPLSVTLNWSCSDPDNDPLTYDVYYGTSSTPPRMAQGRTSTSYSLPTLVPGTAYYWQIVAFDDHSHQTAGPVWKFTTASTLSTGITGIVKDAVSGTPLSGVGIVVYSTSTQVASGTTSASGTFDIGVATGSGYRVVFNKTGYLTATYQNVGVTSGPKTVLETVLQIDNTHSGTGTVSGTMRNALTNVGVGSVSLQAREGINVQTGTVVKSATTSSSGSYSFTSLTAGNYTVEASASGYTTTYFTVICIGGTTTSGQDAVISPAVPPGETRIVLTWGATPSDLDAHLTGPLSDGTRFHVYWDNKVVTGANLDIDDISSYGPETITITNQIAGLYRFSVHDFSNELLTSSSALSQSGAQVRVYRGSTLIATYNVPQNIPGTLWTVFELNGTTITTVNSMTYAGHSGDVTKVSLVGEDPALFRGLPSKRQSLQISR